MDDIVQRKIDEIEKLVLRHSQALQRLCAEKAHGHYDEARDMMQDIVLTCCQRRDEFRDDFDDSEGKRWLFSVARTVIFRHNQRKRHRIALVRLNPDSPIVSEQDLGSLHNTLLEMATECLTPGEQRLVSLRLEGYTYDEIAAMTGTSGAALRKQMERSIKKIRIHHDINLK